MNDQDYKTWIAALPKLSAMQLNDLSNRMKILSFVAAKEFSNGKSDFGNRVVEVTCNFFRSEGIECPTPNLLKRSQAYVQAKGKIDNLATFFEKISQHKLVQDAVLAIAIENLYNELVQWGISVSSHTVLQNIHRVPAVLNRSYPGYAQSGLLHKIVKV